MLTNKWRVAVLFVYFSLSFYPFILLFRFISVIQLSNPFIVIFTVYCNAVNCFISHVISYFDSKFAIAGYPLT